MLSNAEGQSYEIFKDLRENARMRGPDMEPKIWCVETDTQGQRREAIEWGQREGYRVIMENAENVVLFRER